jgi:hypothetical protein
MFGELVYNGVAIGYVGSERRLLIRFQLKAARAAAAFRWAACFRRFESSKAVRRDYVLASVLHGSGSIN